MLPVIISVTGLVVVTMSPLHPVKVELSSGVAVRVTTMPKLYGPNGLALAEPPVPAVR